MADAVIGSAYLQVIPKMDMKSLKTQGASAGKSSGAAFSKSFGGGLNSLKSKATNAFKTISKAATLASAAYSATIGVVGKQAFDAYASYEQLSGGITKLFGDADQTVMQNAQRAYQTAGMSANDYMQQVSGFAAALTNSLGGDTVKAAEQADVAMRAISDNVNTFGTDIDTVTQAYQGFARQQYQMLDSLRLGYGGTKSEMERLIADANEWGKANGKASDLSIDSFSDVVTAIEYIQEAQHIAGTTAAEAGRTISGSIGAAKAAWTNLLTEFGKSNGDIKGAMEALVTSIVGDGTDSNLGVIGNVVPRIGIIIKNAVEQIPGLVMAVAPRIGSAFLEAFDSATNGLGTKVLQFLAPVTDAIGGVVNSIGAWFAQNKGAIDSVVGALGNFASAVIDGIGNAIRFVSPIIGDLASGALPILSAAFSAAAGFVQGLGNMLSGLLDAISPVTDALAPIVDAIGTALVDALNWAGDAMGNADFSGFASIVKDALGGIVDFIDRTVQGISGFFGKVADFMKDPIGSIKRGFETLSSSGEKTGTKVAGSFSKLTSNVSGSLSKLNGTVRASKDGVSADFARMDSNVASSVRGAGGSLSRLNNSVRASKDGVSSDFARMDSSVAASVRGTIGSIDKYNRTPLEGKSSTAEVYGNAVNSVASAAVSTASDAIKALTSKTVWAQVNGNATEGGTATNIWSVASGINSLVSKTVDVVTNFIQNFFKNAAGGIRYHADGMILNRATWIGGRDIAGEAGAEAIIPLTNKRYTRPFAETVAEQMAGHAGGTNIYINGAKVNDDPQIAAAFERFMMAANRKWAM